MLSLPCRAHFPQSQTRSLPDTRVLLLCWWRLAHERAEIVITDAEFAEILGDTTKRVDADIVWQPDSDHLPAQEFRVPVVSSTINVLHVIGWYQPYSGKLSYTVIRSGTGSIYRLCVDSPHRNPDRQWLPGTHKHAWTEIHTDHNAYIPLDISATWHDPESAWKQFCTEFHLEHRGRFQPPVLQTRLKT